MAPGVAIMPSQSRTVVAAETIRRGSTPSMMAGLPALPRPTMRPSLIPRSPLTMPITGSMTSDVAQQQVERALRAGHAGGEPDAVAQRLAAAVQAFVAVDGVILLDDGDQRGIGEAHAVADRRAVERRIVPARNRDHGETSRALEAGLARAPQRGLAHRWIGRDAIASAR